MESYGFHCGLAGFWFSNSIKLTLADVCVYVRALVVLKDDEKTLFIQRKQNHKNLSKNNSTSTSGDAHTHTHTVSLKRNFYSANRMLMRVFALRPIALTRSHWTEIAHVDLLGNNSIDVYNIYLLTHEPIMPTPSPSSSYFFLISNIENNSQVGITTVVLMFSLLEQPKLEITHTKDLCHSTDGYCLDKSSYKLTV